MSPDPLNNHWMRNDRESADRASSSVTAFSEPLQILPAKIQLGAPRLQIGGSPTVTRDRYCCYATRGTRMWVGLPPSGVAAVADHEAGSRFDR